MLEEARNRIEKACEAERRRGEVLRALEEEEVAGLLAAIGFIALLKATAISAAFSLVTSGIVRALTPRQKFTTGQLQGTLQVPQSDQGLPIVEGYGADPAYGASAFQASHAYALEERVVAGGYFYVVTTAGTSDASVPAFPAAKGASVTSGTVVFTNYGRTGGGFRLPMIVVWTSGIRKHVTKTTTQGGGKGPKAPEQTEITYDLDFAVMPGRGPLRVKRIRANTETIYQNYLAPSVSYEAEDAGNTLTNASVITTSYASGGQTVQMEISTGAVQFPGVLGAGSSTQIGIGYVASGTRTCQVWVNGSLATTLTLPGGDGSLRWYVATVNIPETASNVVKLVNTSGAGGALLYLDRISVGGVTTPTGVPDPFVPPDDPYDPDLPFDPNDPYERPGTRYAGLLAEDGDGVKSGPIQAGAYSNLSIYPGNDTQLPDPTMQAAVDALYGPDSTPAFRRRCLVVLTNFFLTNFGGAIPLIQTLADHETLHTLEAIYAHWCGRVGVLETTDYDFAGVRRIFTRGFPVTPPYNPADVMEELARVYNVYFVEADKIYAFVRNSQAVVAALTSKDVGWVDGETEEDDGELPALDFDLATETEIARRYELTFVDPGRDFEQNSQGTSRQITVSEKTEKIELALTLHPEEAREAAQRELYEEHVESAKHRLDLDWSYLWLRPGDSITVAETDGTTSRIFVESFRPNVGVCPVEGFAEETAVYSQPVSTSGGGVFEIPPVPIPAMTLVSFIDLPALQTADEGRAGFYAYVVRRAGEGNWAGAALYKMVEGEPQLVTTFDKQAVAGVAVTKLGAWTDTEVEDSARTVTADAGTDVLTSTAHELEDNETVMFSSAGTLPAGLSASTVYYVRDRAANTFKVALTAGGSAIDITSAGTGAHSVQRVVEVDLHDRETVLSSVTADQIANGANPCLSGNEVMQIRTWELVAGYPRRWRGRNFTRGLRGTSLSVGDHTAGERFVALDSAIAFVPQDIGELFIEREYRAVTSGQSLDDAAAVDYAWLGGTLKFHPPNVQATRDAVTGDWRFLLLGVETTDPEGERYLLDVEGGRSFVIRGAASRPVSLSNSSVMPDDFVTVGPVKGKSQYVDADMPGNSVSDTDGAYAIQLVKGERTAVSFTYETTLKATDTPITRESSISFSPGPIFGLSIVIRAETAAGPGYLTIGGVTVSTGGEASGTRYSVEFIDGKAKFYRNRQLGGEPFHVEALPVFVGDEIFPMEVHVVAASDTTLRDIEIDDVGAALVYTAAEQVADFGSAQTSLTVRALQQRVVQGVIVNGVETEATFP